MTAIFPKATIAKEFNMLSFGVRRILANVLSYTSQRIINITKLFESTMIRYSRADWSTTDNDNIVQQCFTSRSGSTHSPLHSKF